MTRWRSGVPIRPLPWFSTAFVAATLFAGNVAAVETRATATDDRALDLSLHHTFGPASYHVFELITTLGGGVVRISIIALVVLGLVLLRRWWSAAFTVISAGGAALLGELIKLVVARPRPHLFPHAVHAGGYSFPSGHATNVCAFALVAVILAWQISGRWMHSALIGVLLVVYVLLVGLSRIVLGVHYPSDVIGGYFLAVGWVALTVALFAGGLNHEQSRALSRHIDVVD